MVFFQDYDKDKEGDGDVTYANLDKSAMNGKQNNGSTVSIEDESRTEYAEIQPSKKWWSRSTLNIIFYTKYVLQGTPEFALMLP